MYSKNRLASLSAILIVGVLAGCGGMNSSSNSDKSPSPTPSITTAAPTVTLTAQSTTITAGTSVALSWTSTNADSVTIDNGIGTEAANGSVNVAPSTTTKYTATAAGSGGTSTSAVTITVAQPQSPPVTQNELNSITVMPATVSLQAPATQKFTATGIYSDGTPHDITTQVTWRSSNPNDLTIDSTGLATSVGAGSVTLTATLGQVSGTATATITLPPPPPPPPPTAVNVPTWHYDNQRTGLNANETILTPTNVKSGSFGKLFSYTVDGYVYAQPLYVSNLTTKGAQHNVLFVATMYDSVYAFDADNYGTGAPLWKVSLLQNGEQPISASSPGPWIGVLSTPAIDTNTNTIYVVSAQQIPGKAGTFRLHALDLSTGAEKNGAPVVVTASVPGTNSDSANGVTTLTTSWLQRTALLLSNGVLYFGFSGHHSGWVLSYDVNTLKQLGAFNASPDINGYGTYSGAGGVWMGGGGPAADSQGYVYFSTGNGPYDGTKAWGESVLKVDSKLTIKDSFTPYEYAFLQCQDLDLSGGGLMIIPGTNQIVTGGKQGKLYLLDGNDLGRVQSQMASTPSWDWLNPPTAPYPATCNDSQGNPLSASIIGYQIFSTAAWFDNSLFIGPTPGPLNQVTYDNGNLKVASIASESVHVGSYGTTPVVSANGALDGIVWMLDHGDPIQNANHGATPTSAILRAYDATDITKELYDSAQVAADAAGLGIKFTSPVVANGKVYIGTAHDPISSTTPKPQGEIDVYGLK